jgi:integrase
MRENKKSRRSNGAGYTYRVGNSWKTVIEVGGQRVTATNKSQQESRRLAREKAHKVVALNKGTISGAYKVLFSDHLMPWLDNQHRNQIAHSTYRRYRGIAKHYVIPALGNVAMQKLTKKDIAQFMNSLAANNVKPRTRNQALALISVALKGAIDAGLIDSNPANGVPKAAEIHKSIKPLTQNEVTQLLTATAGQYLHARLHLCFMGLRQGEALGLRWRNVDLDKGVILLEEQAQKIYGKSDWVKLKSNMSNRKVYLSDSTVEALMKHRAILAQMRLAAGTSWQDHDLVFPNKVGGFLQQKVDYARWRRALDACGISARRLHDGRHTAGTLLYANGEGIETIRRVLGHSSVNLTSRTYVHNAEEPLREAAQTMNGIFSKTNHVA